MCGFLLMSSGTEIECLPHLYRAYSESLDDRLVGKNVTKMIEAEG